MWSKGGFVQSESSVLEVVRYPVGAKLLGLKYLIQLCGPAYLISGT